VIGWYNTHMRRLFSHSLNWRALHQVRASSSLSLEWSKRGFYMGHLSLVVDVRRVALERTFPQHGLGFDMPDYAFGE
jgi:hypothetical protein